MTFRSLVVAFALAATLVPAAQAQNAVRLGYIDPDIIIVQMPEYREVQTQLQARQREIATDLQTREDTLRQRFEELQTMAASAVTSASAREAREQDILRRQQQLEDLQQAGLQELSRREAELMQPLLTRLQDAIDEEATAQNITMVFAARANNAPVLLYANEQAVNLTEPILRRLGIEIREEGAGAEPAGGND
ncbi:MAG TPA: OmpH family outer membrane protein [Rubricoccaceae bacterium]|nr:OmpH family outer membrane protein [Rubricoccaceae bacterium]